MYEFFKIKFDPKPGLWRRFVNWFKKRTGREIYFLGVDYAVGPDRLHWTVAKKDVKTGAFTIVDAGSGRVPEAYRALRES